MKSWVEALAEFHRTTNCDEVTAQLDAILAEKEADWIEEQQHLLTPGGGGRPRLKETKSKYVILAQCHAEDLRET